MPTTTPSRVADQDSFELAQTQGRTNGAGSEKSPVSGFSLNDLMQCENFDSVENNLQELHSFTYQFPETSGSLNSHVTNVELDIMVNLCGDIDSCLKRIRRLRNQEPESPVNASRSSDSRVSSNSYRRKKQTRRAKLSCHHCNIGITPLWRMTPDGTRTLCNVCGLMEAKRVSRRAGRFTK